MTFIRWLLGKIILTLDALFSPKPTERTSVEQLKIEGALANHVIYQYEACPFCVKVRRFMKGAGIMLPLRDAKVEPYRSELVNGGGKAQVPCLQITKDGAVQWMYESDAIIAYLKSKIG